MTKFQRAALIFSTLLLLSGCASGAYDIGEHDVPLSVEQSVEDKSGIVVLSTQTQYQLVNNLYIYFIREGARDGDKSQMIKIYRAAGVPIAGTNSTSREYQALQVSPGNYTLYAHSIGYFPDIRPGASVRRIGRGLWAGQVYPRGSVSFEVTSEKIAYIGDIWLEAPLVAGEVEPDTRDMKDLTIRFGEPRVNEVDVFLRKFSNLEREADYVTEVPDSLKSNVTCQRHEGDLVRPWTCLEE